jgi:hypothetical protein
VLLGGCQTLQMKEEYTNLSYDNGCTISSVEKSNFSLIAVKLKLIAKPMQLPQE